MSNTLVMNWKQRSRKKMKRCLCRNSPDGFACTIVLLNHTAVGKSRPIRSLRSLWSGRRLSKAQLVLVSIGVSVPYAETEKLVILASLMRFLADAVSTVTHSSVVDH